MKKYWQQYLAAFDALTLRERLMVAAAVIVGMLFLAYQFSLGPQWARAKAARARMSQIEHDTVEMQNQIQILQGQMRDPNAANRQALEETRQQLAGLDERFRKIGQSLVPAGQMSEFLHHILAKNRGVSLVSLHTLAPTPMLAAGGDAAGDAPAAAKSPADKGETRLFRHGIELKVAGAYPDLLAYVADLEKESGRLLWGRMELTVDKYPRSVLTLTVYTLGLSKDWLAL